jgi:hypothetical protein
MRLALGRRLLPALSLLVAAVPAAAQSPVQKVQLVAADTLTSLSWHSLAADPKGDGLHPRLPDAKELSYAVDPKTNLVWFKVTAYEPLPESWFGINIAIDGDGNPDNGMTWWGTNKFKFDRLASAYLFSAEGYWQGVAGVADSEGAGHTLFTNLSRDVKVARDREQRAILLGVPRSALGTAPTVRVIATVGSMMINNDDAPNEGAVTVKLTP